MWSNSRRAGLILLGVGTNSSVGTVGMGTGGLNITDGGPSSQLAVTVVATTEISVSGRGDQSIYVVSTASIESSSLPTSIFSTTATSTTTSTHTITLYTSTASGTLSIGASIGIGIAGTLTVMTILVVIGWCIWKGRYHYVRRVARDELAPQPTSIPDIAPDSSNI